ncbi:hypothetical protein [Sorangium sp. So ce513]|uniref:hypothetical protein n=1 Tax=Sorangium sp. So ce513 TaxID=3133315 RepID=UPI003F60C740
MHLARERVHEGRLLLGLPAKDIVFDARRRVLERIAFIRAGFAHHGAADDPAERVEGDGGAVEVRVGDVPRGKDTVVVLGLDLIVQRIRRGLDEQRKVVVGDEGVRAERVDRFNGEVEARRIDCVLTDLLL